MTDGSTTTRTGRSRKQSVKSVLYRVSKFLDGCVLGSAYFVNFEELRLKMAILKMKMALLSLKKLKMALCAGTPTVASHTVSRRATVTKQSTVYLAMPSPTHTECNFHYAE